MRARATGLPSPVYNRAVRGSALLFVLTACHGPEGTVAPTDGALVRLDVRSPALHTAENAKVGTPAATLRRLYPDAIEEPNKYDPEGSTWIVGPPDRAHFVFELDRTHRVVRWRAGVPPQVDWV